MTLWWKTAGLGFVVLTGFVGACIGWTLLILKTQDLWGGNVAAIIFFMPIVILLSAFVGWLVTYRG